MFGIPASQVPSSLRKHRAAWADSQVGVESNDRNGSIKQWTREPAIAWDSPTSNARSTIRDCDLPGPPARVAPT